MDIVYLGIFQTILNWVIEKILSPVFKFVANLLATVLGWVFDTVLGPLLQAVLLPLAEIVINLVFEAFAEVFYRIFVAVLTLVDYMQIAFDVLIGIKNVTYRSPTGAVIQEPLLDVLFYQDSVSNVFWMVTILGLSIAFVFTIYATAKSVFDLDFEGKRPVGLVLKAFMKTCMNFLAVPLFVLFMLKLSTIILIGVTSALTQGNESTLGNTIFLVSSMDAALAEEYNTSYDGSGSVPKIANVGFEDNLRYPYFKGQKTYADIEEVRKEFKFSRIDYVVGYGVSIFMLIILAICLIQFVQRIFEVLLLYVVSPLFVSVMPLDDGEKFGGWRELFIAKCFMGFGAAVGMRLYLLIVPIVMGNTIDFAGGGYISTEMNYVIKLLIIMGGAFAIFKSSSMLTMLLNWRAGDSEASTASAVGGAMYGYTVGKATHGISRGIHQGIDRMHQSHGEKKEKGQAFHGGAGSEMSGKIPGLSNSRFMGGGNKGFGDLTKDQAEEKAKGITKYRFNEEGRMTKYGKGGNDMPERAHSITTRRDWDGKMRKGYQSAHMDSGFGSDGKFRVRSINRKFFKMENHKDGQRSVSMPIISLRDGPNGKLKFDGVNLGVFKTARGLDGKQHLKSMNFGPVKTGRGWDGKQHLKSVNIKAAKFHDLPDGKIHLSRVLGQNVEYSKDKDGNYRVSGIDMEKFNSHLEFQRESLKPQEIPEVKNTAEEKARDARRIQAYNEARAKEAAAKKAKDEARIRALARVRSQQKNLPMSARQRLARTKAAQAKRPETMRPAKSAQPRQKNINSPLSYGNRQKGGKKNQKQNTNNKRR